MIIKRFSAILLIALSLFISLTSFLKPMEGEFIIEYKGKKFVADTLEGGIVVTLDKKVAFNIAGESNTGGKSFRVQIDCHPLVALKTGKYELTTMENHIDKHLKDGCILANYGTLASGDEAAPQNPEDIAMDSDSGTLTISTININNATHEAYISGAFEFTGQNDLEYAAEKTVSIKGTFKNLVVDYIAPPGR